MGELRIWKGADVRTARGMEALSERTMAERNMVIVNKCSDKAVDKVGN